MASLEQELSISCPTLGPVLSDYMAAVSKDMDGFQPTGDGPTLSSPAVLSTEGACGTGTNGTTSERRSVGFATPRRVCPKCDEYVPRNQPDCRCHVSAATEPDFDFVAYSDGDLKKAGPRSSLGDDTPDRKKEADGSRKRTAESEDLSGPKKRLIAAAGPDLGTDAHKLVYFDLETTGLWGSSEVVQIVALTGDDEYSRYILPESDIDRNASLVNGLHSREGCLYLNGVEVETEDRHEAWIGLLDFLDKYDTPVILVGHNIATFDMRMTRVELRYLGLEERFEEIVPGVVDTLKVVRKALPNRDNYKLQDIAIDLDVVDTMYGAHNARGDVRTTRNVVERLDLPDEHLKAFFDSFAERREKKRRAAAKAENVTSLSPLKNSVSNIMIGRIAGPANLGWTDLQAAMRKGGGDEIRRLFTEDCNGKPTVTRNEKTLGIVISMLESLEELDVLEMA